eukprot:TRINITY_DN14746_c0_g1_i1.p1 TRINITY_DN14746_c0_g1~~TRINITY_DN14746_c0_g1_i1.p1  ORF type:complete len:733 (+),score=153.21 TRINITY_DN14746_c0_g1_i1:248-2446(+)
MSSPDNGVVSSPSSRFTFKFNKSKKEKGVASSLSNSSSLNSLGNDDGSGEDVVSPSTSPSTIRKKINQQIVDIGGDSSLLKKSKKDKKKEKDGGKKKKLFGITFSSSKENGSLSSESITPAESPREGRITPPPALSASSVESAFAKLTETPESSRDNSPRDSPSEELSEDSPPVARRERSGSIVEQMVEDELRQMETSVASIRKLRQERRSNAEKKRTNLIQFEAYITTQNKPSLSLSSGPMEIPDIKKLTRINTLPVKTFKHFLTSDDRVRREVPKPIGERLSSGLLFDWEGKPNLDCVRNHFLREGRLELEAAEKLIKKATEILKKEPNLLQLKAPQLIFGDIHGQFFDLMNMLQISGDPKVTSHLFLGDYVDRGNFSTEVAFYLLAMKVKHPENVHLLRGNHESRAMSQHFDFHTECRYKYNDDIFELMMECFDCLPLAAVVKTTDLGSFFCVHGGLSPEIITLDDINLINRFDEPPDEGPFCDLLWSDPLVIDRGTPEAELDDWAFVRYNYNSRGCGYVYGFRAVKEFLKTNELATVIRGHEVQKEGYYRHLFGYEDYGHLVVPGENILPVITVFSAPNYCGIYDNKACFMRLENTKYSFEQFSAVPAPYYLPRFMNCITYTLPALAEAMMKASAFLLSYWLCGDEDDRDPIDESLLQKIKGMQKISVLLKLRREDFHPDQLNKAIVDEGFESVKRADMENERPRSTGNAKRSSLLRPQLQRNISCKF